MNDIRRTILWVIFGFSMILLWDAWQIHNGQKATFFPQPPKAGTVAAPVGVAASSAPAASNGVPQASSASTTANPAIPGAANASAAPIGVAPVAQAIAAQNIDVSTDLLKLRFSTEGGKLVRAELLAHKELERSEERRVGKEC